MYSKCHKEHNVVITIQTRPRQSNISHLLKFKKLKAYNLICKILGYTFTMFELGQHGLLSINRSTLADQQTLSQVLLIKGFKHIFSWKEKEKSKGLIIVHYNIVVNNTN